MMNTDDAQDTTSAPHRYSEVLRALAPIIAELPTGGEVLRLLADFERMADPYDRTGAEFDTAEAVYYIAALWHGGQWSPWYRASSVLVGQFRYSPGFSSRPDRGSSSAIIAAGLHRIERTLARA